MTERSQRSPGKNGFDEDAPEYRELDRLTGDRLASKRVDLGKRVHVLAVQQTRLHRLIYTITDILRRRRRDGTFEVTDHALVRYLERQRGIDVASIRAEMVELAETALGTRPVKGDAIGLDVECGLTFVVTRDRLIVTAYPTEGDPLHG